MMKKLLLTIVLLLVCGDCHAQGWPGYLSGGGSSWQTPGSLSGLTLGTSTSVTNPQRSGDATTGFYSAATGTVAVEGASIEAMQWNTVASGVDYLSITPGLSGTPPLIAGAGSTSGQSIEINPNGGPVLIGTSSPLSGSSGTALQVTKHILLAVNGTNDCIQGTTSSGSQANIFCIDSSNDAEFFNPGGSYKWLNATQSAADMLLSNSGALTIGTPGTSGITGTLALSNGTTSGANTTIAPSGSTTTAWTLTLPTSGGTTGYVLQTNGSGTTSWVAQSGGGSGTVNSGTAGQLAYYASSTTTISGNADANISSGTLTLGVASTTLGALIEEGSTSGAVTIEPQATAGTWTLELPTSGGTSGYALQTNGSGVASWSANANAYTVEAGPSATTAVALSQRYKRWVDVSEYGAVANGSTSDCTDVQNAINDNPTANIYFPIELGSGHYWLPCQITLTNSSGDNFQGNLISDGAELDFSGAGGASTDTDAAMKNGIVAYPTTNGAGGDTTGWNGTNAVGGYVTGFYLNCPSHGACLHVGNSIDLKIEHNLFNGGRYGFVAETSIGIEIDKNIFLNQINAGVGMLYTSNSNIYYESSPPSTNWDDDINIHDNSFSSTVAGGLAFILDAGSQSERIRHIYGNHFFSGSTSDIQYGYISRNAQPDVESNWFENINYPVRMIASNSNEGGSTTTLTGVTAAEPSGTWQIGSLPDGYSYGGIYKNNYFQGGKIDLNLSGVTAGPVIIGANVTNGCQSSGYHIYSVQGGKQIVDLGDKIISGSCSYLSNSYGGYLSLAGLTADTTGDLTLNSVIHGGTTFSVASGCGTVGSKTGGATAGSFTAGQASCLPVLSLPTAPNGWRCSANDLTHPSDAFTQTASSATSCTLSATVTSGDTVQFEAQGY
ncbi:MAG: hypothetical protein WAL34_04080 [Acidobacteriaceae bacterium]